jgi:gliding motility-associated lipoprotein GldK
MSDNTEATATQAASQATTTTTETSLLDQAISATKQTDPDRTTELLQTLTNEALSGTVVYSKSFTTTINTAIEKIDAMIVTPDNRIFGKKEIDATKIKYKSEVFDYKAAAQNRDVTIPRSAFILKNEVMVYPDTLCWVRDFAYSYNEPMAKKYFAHAAYGNYPVVGVNWKQSTAFCEWRTHYLNSFLESKKRSPETDFRLPTEAQWEYAARGGLSQVQFPWGGPYLRNRKGCLLANFKPGRGNYPEDGGFYTVKVYSYNPNGFGLYCMAGNVAEWCSTAYDPSAYEFETDMSADYEYDAKDGDHPAKKRKVTRGGSLKDIGFYLMNSTRSYEYQDTAKSYIGFRNTMTHLGRGGKNIEAENGEEIQSDITIK